MSVFIKINGWFGGDQQDSTARFTKVFRMSDDEGESAMGQICQNDPWQFQHQTSDSQSQEAQTYLNSLGFDVELIPLSDDDWDMSDDTLPDDSLPETMGEKELPKDDPKKKSKTVLAVILLIVMAGVGLTQTQQGKDLLNVISTKSSELFNSAGGDKKPDSPAGKPTKDIQAIEKVVIVGEPSMKYPMTLSGCLDTRDELTSVLRKADLDQTQSTELCKGKTIANPATEWKCEYKSLSQICNNRETYSCVAQFQCIPETEEYNREKFKRIIETLS